MSTQYYQTLIQLLVIGSKHSSLSASNMFYGMKREYRDISKVSITAILPFPDTVNKITPWCMARIFYDPQTILISQFPVRFKIYCSTRIIYHYNTMKSAFRCLL